MHLDIEHLAMTEEEYEKEFLKLKKEKIAH